MIENFQDKINQLKQTLTKDQQKMLSLNSIQNFVLAYNSLTKYKPEVLDLLTQYFNEIEKYGYVIDKPTSTDIAFKYISTIGTYYGLNLNFKIQTTLRFALITGILVDLILLATGILKNLYFLPVSTLLMLIYWYYIKVFFEKRNWVHGVRY